MEIERGLLELYRDPTLDTKPALLEHRGGAFYSEAAAQLIASLHAGTGDVQVVDVRNDGALPDLPDDAVVEIPARIDRDGAHPLPLAPLAPEMRGLVQAVKAYEELTIAGGRSAATGAMPSRRSLANPLVPDLITAEPLLNALLDSDRRPSPPLLPARDRRPELGGCSFPSSPRWSSAWKTSRRVDLAGVHSSPRLSLTRRAGSASPTVRRSSIVQAWVADR